MSEKPQETTKELSVREAGRLGGLATSRTHGTDFYQRIGRKGGGRVRELIAAGKAEKKEDWKEKYILRNFFTPKEADELIAAIRSRIRGGE
jgi:uncharacterized protein